MKKFSECRRFPLLCGRVLLRSRDSHYSIASQKIENYCTQNKEKVIKSIQLNKPGRPKENVPNGKPSGQSSRKSPFKVSSLLLLSLPVGKYGIQACASKRPVPIRSAILHSTPCALRQGSNGNNPSGLMGSANSTSHGSHIVTPFKLHGSDIVIMINRGWLPPSKVQAELSNKERTSPIVELDAIVRKPEVKPWFFEANMPEKSVWLYKDFEQMGQWCGALPIFVDAVYESSVPNGPIGGQTNVTLRNEHLNYMITWFSLSAFTFGTWMMTYAKGLWRK
uniref:SURF1-like protein n=1 Tax=Ditylenchus dipsaci TaxID=166011 RepID=A0A915EDE5_9BILA